MLSGAGVTSDSGNQKVQARGDPGRLRHVDGSR